MNNSSTIHSPQLGWNAGGWFGGSLGSIAWLAYAAATTFSQHVTAAAILLGLFVGPLLLTLLFWQRRHSTPILRAMNIMLTVNCLAVAAAFYVLYHYQVRGFISIEQFPTNVFIIIPIMYMVLLWRFRSLNKPCANVA